MSFKNQEQPVNTLCKLQFVIDPTLQIGTVLTNTTKVSVYKNSAGWFCLPQKLIDFSCSPPKARGSLTFHA